jgi:hypothetical protein
VTYGILSFTGVVAILLVGAYFMSNQASLDIAGPLRNWLRERDARKMSARNHFPASLTRAYWNAGEYERDAARLRALGYAVASETESEQYLKLPDVEWRRGQQPPRRRIPNFHVIYERGGRALEAGTAADQPGHVLQDIDAGIGRDT